MPLGQDASLCGTSDNDQSPMQGTIRACMLRHPVTVTIVRAKCSQPYIPKAFRPSTRATFFGMSYLTASFASPTSLK